MATQVNSLPCDCSTFANFKSWASRVSSNFGAALGGFVKTSEPGQVVWTTLTATITLITGNSGSGTVTVTTSAAHGFSVGTVVTISGTTNFNGSFAITAVTSTTFSYAQTNANPNENAGTATVNAQTLPGDTLQANNAAANGQTNTAFPTTWRGIYSAGTTYAVGDLVWSSNNVFLSIVAANLGNTPVGGAADTNWKSYCYEIWESNDGLTPYFIKLEYGQTSTANVPLISFTLGSNSNGQSALSGNVGVRELPGTSALNSNGQATAPTANTSTFECDFFGRTNGSSLCLLMWRTITTTGMSLVIAFERGRNSSGSDTSQYVTYLCNAGANNSTTASTWRQCSLLLSGSPAIGPRTNQAVTIASSTTDTPAPSSSANSWQVGNNVAVLPVFPAVGSFSNPLLVIQGLGLADAIEGNQFQVSMYGSIHTYLMTKAAWTQRFNNNGAALSAFAIRWE